MKRNSKRFLSLLLSLAMIFTLVGTPVYADDDSGEVTAVSEETASGSEEATSDSAVITSDSSASSAAEELQAQIDALPSVDELSAMTTEEQNEVYEQFLTLCEAYDALTEEEQAQVDDSALDALADYFNGTAVTADEEGGSSTGLPEAVDGVITLTGDVSLESLEISSSTTIDLASYTLTLTDGGITLSADLTVKDSGGSGVITNADTSNDLITVNADNVKVTVDGGTLKSGCDGIYSYNHTGVSVVMNGGTITTADGASGNDAIHFYSGSENSVTINDGVIEAVNIAVEFNYSTSACYVNVNGGSFKQGSSYYGIIVGAITVIKDGYEWTTSGGYYTVAEYSGDTVATVNGTGYTTLRAAFAAATSGDTIYLAKDYTVDEVVGLGYQCGAEVAYKNVTFDLNGHTITVDSTAGGNNFALIYVHKDSTLTLTDSSSDSSGKIDIQTSSTYAVRNYGNFVMNGGTISSVGYGIESAPYYKYGYSDNYTVEYVSTTTTINGGTIIGTSSSADVLRVDNATDCTAELTINDVDFTGSIRLGGTANTGITAEINGGTYTAATTSSSLINIQNASELTINGGTFEAAEGTYSTTSLITISGSYGGTLTVNDGEFTTDGEIIYVSNSSTSYEYDVTLNGGTYTAGNTVIYVSSTTKSNYDVDLTGGTYSPEPDSSYCADGTTVIPNGDGTYSIISADENAVAVISDSDGNYTSYSTLKAASAALSDGCTVTLVANSYDSPFTLDEDYDVTLELNGYSINMSTSASSPRIPITVSAGTLTIKDSSSAGTGEIAGGSKSTAAIYNTNGNLIIDGGTYKILKTYTGAILTNGENAVTTINDGKIYGVTYALQNSLGKLNINGGYFYAATGDTIEIAVSDSETESAAGSSGSCLMVRKENGDTYTNITDGYFLCGTVFTDVSTDTTGNAVISTAGTAEEGTVTSILISGGIYSGNRYNCVKTYLDAGNTLTFISDTASDLYIANYRYEVGLSDYVLGSYNEDGEFTAYSGYSTAKDAIAAATSEYNVVVVNAASSKDDPITTAISASNTTAGEIILDLNGCYITCENSSAISVSAGTTLTIIDSQDSAVVKSGVGQAGVVRNAGGVLTIKGGTYEQTSTDNFVFAVYTATAYGSSLTTEEQNATATNIEGGTFISESGYAFGSYIGTLSITGGSVNANSVLYASSSVTTEQTVTGGYYSVDPTAYVADGYSVYSYNVSPYLYEVTKTRVAQIGDTYYTTLKAAFSAAASGDTITLLTDTTLTSRITVNGGKTVTLDLDGHTVTDKGFTVNNGSLTVKNGTVSASQPFNVYGSSSDVANYSVLNIESDVTISEPTWGICLFPYSNTSMLGYGAVINMYGTIKDEAGDSVGIFVSGNLGNSADTSNAMAASDNVSTINIYGTISTVGPAVAMNGYAVVNVYDGASLTGSEAIGVKRGVLNVYGGTLTATGDYVDPAEANYNGTESTGAAISVTSTYNYAGVIVVNITGGTITSTNGNALYIGHSSDTSYTVGLEVSVAGGSFTGGTDQAAVYVAEANDSDAESYTQAIISDGYFNTIVAAEYCADGFVPTTTANEEGMYTVTTGIYVVSVKNSSGEVVAKYTTVSEAANSAYAAEGGYTIVLLDDVIEDVVIPSTANVTLDLAGYSITSSSSHAIANYGTLVITDSSATEDSDGTGKVQAAVSGYAALYNQGSVTVKGGYFTRTNGQWYTVVNDSWDWDENGNTKLDPVATMTFEEGVTVKTSPDIDNNSSMIRNYGGVMTVNGGTFTSDCLSCIKNEPDSTLTINDGTITNSAVSASTKQGAIINTGIITVNGGTINSYRNAIFSTSSSAYGTAEINGGVFNNTDTQNVTSVVLKYQNNTEEVANKQIISGGTFNGYGLASSYVCEGQYMLFDYTYGASALTRNTTVTDSFDSEWKYEAMRVINGVKVYCTDADAVFDSTAIGTTYSGTIYLYAEFDSITGVKVNTTGFTLVLMDDSLSTTESDYSSHFTCYAASGYDLLTSSGTTEVDSETKTTITVYQGVTETSANAVITYGSDTVYCATLLDAVTAANALETEDEITITVLNTHSSSGTVQPKVDMTIDLNGCTFTSSNTSYSAIWMYTEGITVTITDSSEEQTGEIGRKSDKLFGKITAGTLILTGGHYLGTFDGVGTDAVLEISGGYYVVDPSSYVVSGCEAVSGEYTLDSNTYYYKVAEVEGILGQSSAEGSVPATIESGEGKSTMYVKVSADYISTYTTDNYPTTTLTTDDGNSYIFAGWYSAADESSAMESFPTDTAYAKFVDADVLDVKCVVSEIDSDTIRWRFITSFDTIYYYDVGFYEITKDDVDVTSDLSSVNLCTGYFKVTSIDGGLTTNATDFSTISNYIATAYYDDTDTDSTFTATPYWLTGDGTTVKGRTVTFTYSDEYGYANAE